MKTTFALLMLLFFSHIAVANDFGQAKELSRCYIIVLPPNLVDKEDYTESEFKNLLGLEEHFKKQAKLLAGSQWELVSFMALSWAEGIISTHQFNGEQLHNYRDWVLESCREYYGSGGYKHVRLKDSKKLSAPSSGDKYN
ncbi:hypothetical protein [Photobacterium ganghwense]|uniref:hypothetical protein n=1 Tax=Photobacterium ganghwense TaxID=320778 RepID=UPI001C2D4727|nr:hypothetical protein [Photobacterium ganghwense]MBV1841974.1 hypothetical protein [Photobacterium ganghwense]